MILYFFLGLSLLLGGINIYNQLDNLDHLLEWPLLDENNYKQQLSYNYVCPNKFYGVSIALFLLC